jgi:hypothetical protein
MSENVVRLTARVDNSGQLKESRLRLEATGTGTDKDYDVPPNGGTRYLVAAKLLPLADAAANDTDYASIQLYAELGTTKPLTDSRDTTVSGGALAEGVQEDLPITTATPSERAITSTEQLHADLTKTGGSGRDIDAVVQLTYREQGTLTYPFSPSAYFASASGASERWRIRSATFVPAVGVAADDDDNVSIQIKNGADDVTDVRTTDVAGGAFVADTAVDLPLTGNAQDLEVSNGSTFTVEVTFAGAGAPLEGTVMLEVERRYPLS